MPKHGKAYVEAKSKVDREHEYEPAEAVKLLKELKQAKFDESVEVHIRTGLNVRHADEQLRGTIALPHVLGPQGKMPNPKVGTVTMDVRKAVEESKSGKIEYRTDRTAIVHINIGKTSFDERRLLENYAAVIDEMIRAKPPAAKGRYLRSITITSTMGPGIKIDPTRTRDLLEDAPATAAA